MPTVLSYTNAFPGGAFPQHKASQTTTVQSYLYPGAVQPLVTNPTVLSYTNGFPGAPFPQHKASQTATVQNYLYPGAVQPLGASAVIWGFEIPLFIGRQSAKAVGGVPT